MNNAYPVLISSSMRRNKVGNNLTVCKGKSMTISLSVSLATVASVITSVK